MKAIRALGPVVGLLLLGACTTNHIDDQLRTIEQDPGQGSAFAKGLHKEYIGLARSFQQSNFPSEALFWGDKSAKAGTGDEVPWETVDDQGIPPDRLAESKKSDARLDAVIAAGAKTGAPADLATAQASFDCMIRDWRAVFKAVADGCRKRFEDATAKLEKRAPAVAAEPTATNFWIYFDFDKSNVRPDAAHILDTAVAAIIQLGTKEVVLTGHTDTVGSSEYDLTLSQKRAQSAKRYLTQRGVPANIITTVAKGKTDLRVPTPDNVREQENRNVHVELK
jgi:OmpA-OmpF porin, OOP family